jgi:hypothetical protein
MESQKKYYLNDALTPFLGIMIIVIIVDYLFYAGLLNPAYYAEQNNILFETAIIFKKYLHSEIQLIRAVYVFLLVLGILLIDRIKVSSNLNRKRKFINQILFVITTPIFIYGYTNLYFYDLYFYPVLFVSHIFITTIAITPYKTQFKDENIFGISNLKDKEGYHFSFKVENNKTLTFQNISDHFWIEGGTGSGKSDTFLKSFIKQAYNLNMCGVIYDLEGNPLHDDAPILGRIAYKCYLDNLKKYNNAEFIKKKTNIPFIYRKEKLVKFAFLNFADPTRSVRVNPLSKKYITDASDVSSTVNGFMETLLNKNEKKGGNNDFWDKYGMSFVRSIALRLHYSYPEYLSLPHIICLATYPDDKKIFTWLEAERRVHQDLAGLLSAFKGGASSTLASAKVSGQVPLSDMSTPEAFWILSKDEFNLDLSNRNNPYILVIGNDPDMYKKELYAPSVSVILKTIMTKMHRSRNHPSIFHFDEFPSVKINGIDDFMSQVRKKKISVILGLQGFEQAKRDYGEENARNMRNNANNRAFGRTGSTDTIKHLMDVLGDKEMKSTSHTTSTDNLSINESVKKEKVLQPRTIAGQSTGHFVGQVANGNPPFYFTQFKRNNVEGIDIPQFSNYVTTKDENMNYKIMKNLSVKNKEKILDEAYSIIDNYFK